MTLGMYQYLRAIHGSINSALSITNRFREFDQAFEAGQLAASQQFLKLFWRHRFGIQIPLRIITSGLEQ